MTTSAVSQLLYLFDEGFEGAPWHSLLGNLQSVTDADWLWVPPAGRRSMRDIVQHVAGGKIMYHNHAFGDRQYGWDDPVIMGAARVATRDSAIAWLREGQALLREGIAALDDAELLHPREAPAGTLRETRWIITVMIQHDLYHAGEINHIRALHQGDDV